MLIFVSQIVVMVIGFALFVVAAWGVFEPGKLIGFVTSAMDRHSAIFIAVIVRLVMGAALIVAAPASHFPIVFHGVGVILILAAIILVLMGRERLQRFLVWCSDEIPVQIIRLGLVLGAVFGGFLVYGVL